MSDLAPLAAEECALATSCGVVDLSTRTKIAVRGDDRVSFLHNFCTNDIRGLAVGSGAEAFLLDAKGHIRFHVLIACRPDCLLLDASPGVGEALVRHLDRYIIREKVTLADQTTELAELLVAGNHAPSVIQQVLSTTAPEQPLDSVGLPEFGEPAFVQRSVQTAAPNFAVVVPRANLETLQQRLIAAGAVACGFAVWNVARIEAGFPRAELDIGEKTLAQEVNRNDRTLNFRKGCYLGQETVARLDALGHVNRVLVGIRQATELPPTPEIAASSSELTVADSVVGRITSQAYSAARRAVVGLAYVATAHSRAGSQLQSATGPFEVVDLPMT